METNTFELNTWYRDKTGISKLHYVRDVAIDGKQMVLRNSIPRFTPYYFKFVKNMRTPMPTMTVFSVGEYESAWYSECVRLLNKELLEDKPSVEHIAELARNLYEDYGIDCIEPSEAINRRMGTRETRWVKEVASQLEKRAGTPEYEAIGTVIGENILQQAEYLYEHFGKSGSTPNEGVVEYFSLLSKLRNSKIVEGVVLTITMPPFIKERFNVPAIEVIGKGNVTYRGAEIIGIDYEDDEKTAFTIFNDWLGISNQKHVPSDVYTGSMQMTGINNVSRIKERKSFTRVFPVAVSPTRLELRVSPAS